MSAKSIFAVLSLCALPLFGCAAQVDGATAGEEAAVGEVGDDEVGTAEDAVASTRRFPQCRAVGTRSEGWYWSDSSARIGWASCGASVVQCGAFGTRSEGWYADGKRVAYGTCSTATTTRLGALSAGLQYPSESDVAFDVVLVPGVGTGTLDAARLRKILKLDAATPIERTTVNEALAARRFEEHPDAAKFEALRKGLSGYKAFRVGTIQVQIYFVKISQGELVGLHTVSIET